MGAENLPSVSFWNPSARVMNNLHEFQGDEEPDSVGWFYWEEVVEPKIFVCWDRKAGNNFQLFHFFFSVMKYYKAQAQQLRFVNLKIQ